MRSTNGELFDVFNLDPDSIARTPPHGMEFVLHAMSSGGKRRKLRIKLGGYELSLIVLKAAEHATKDVQDAIAYRERLSRDFDTRIKG